MTDADAATPQADPPVSGAGDAPPRRKRGMRRRPDLSVLEERIGHRFADRDLLVQALTHVSATNGRGSYQRLEFLGDRVLGLAVADGLYNALPVRTRATCRGACRAWCGARAAPRSPMPGRSGRT